MAGRTSRTRPPVMASCPARAPRRLWPVLESLGGIAADKARRMREAGRREPPRPPDAAPCTSEAGGARGYTVATLPGFGYMVATRRRKAKRATPEDCPKCLIFLVGRAGFEPATNGLKVRGKAHFSTLSGMRGIVKKR